jgi:preprotein translocase subunit SecY
MSAGTSILKSFDNKEIRNKIVITLFILFLYRLASHIPLPQVDPTALKLFFESGNTGGFLSTLSLFTGGGLSNMSILGIGLGPYISASIIIQVLMLMIPSLEEMAKEGTVGRQKINLYTTLLTFPIAVAQSFAIYNLISRQNTGGLNLFSSTSVFDVLLIILIMTAGTYIMMFLGQLITEYGAGQGTSILIFAGIVANLPVAVSTFFSIADSLQITSIIVFIVLSAVVIFGIIFITQAYRKIEIHYSGRSNGGQVTTGGRSYIPIKINQAGVIPIIFAVALTLVPGFLATYLQRLFNPVLVNVGEWLSVYFSTTSILYNVFYFLLVFVFTYFYTSVAFNPQKISEDIRKSGGFIPGIRPGGATVHYLRYVINRLTLAGGVFLGLLAVMPSLVQSFTGITSLAIGGTGLLIVVSVILETVKQIEAQLASREYDKLID